jgi:hypothetical protein
VLHLRRNLPSLSRLRRRVVTQQKFLPISCATGRDAMKHR